MGVARLHPRLYPPEHRLRQRQAVDRPRRPHRRDGRIPRHRGQGVEEEALKEYHAIEKRPRSKEVLRNERRNGKLTLDESGEIECHVE